MEGKTVSQYRKIKEATAEVVGVQVISKSSTKKAHEAIRDVIVANPALSYQQIAKLLGCSRWLVSRVAAEFDVRRPRGRRGPCPQGGAVRKKYFGWEQAFRSIWDDADRDGLWNGDTAGLAREFGVSEDTACSVLDELCDRRLIEKLCPGKYIIAKWRERDEPDEQPERY
jgi:hypothetical protein